MLKLFGLALLCLCASVVTADWQLTAQPSGVHSVYDVSLMRPNVAWLFWTGEGVHLQVLVERSGPLPLSLPLVQEGRFWTDLLELKLELLNEKQGDWTSLPVQMELHEAFVEVREPVQSPTETNPDKPSPPSSAPRMVLHLFLEARPAQTGVVWPAGLYRGQVKLPLSKVDPDVADADKALVSPRFEFAVQEANNLQSQLATAAHKGMRFLLQGNPQRAEEACQEMLRLYPSSMEARAGIAQARYDQGDYERAQGSWEEALRLLLEGRDEFIPEHSRSIDDIAARFRFKIGKCQERRGKVAGAKDDE